LVVHFESRINCFPPKWNLRVHSNHGDNDEDFFPSFFNCARYCHQVDIIKFIVIGQSFHVRVDFIYKVQWALRSEIRNSNIYFFFLHCIQEFDKDSFLFSKCGCDTFCYVHVFTLEWCNTIIPSTRRYQIKCSCIHNRSIQINLGSIKCSFFAEFISKFPNFLFIKVNVLVLWINDN